MYGDVYMQPSYQILLSVSGGVLLPPKQTRKKLLLGNFVVTSQSK
jgi:hypothetical protein